MALIPITDIEIEIAVPDTNTGTASDRPNRAFTQALLKKMRDNTESLEENSVSPLTAILTGKGLTGSGTLEDNVTLSAVMTDEFALEDPETIASALALFRLYTLFVQSNKYVGRFISPEALAAAYPTSTSGSYAVVNSGLGEVDTRYLYDESTSTWIRLGILEKEEIKLLYESNDDTNAFTDAYKELLDEGILNLVGETGTSEEVGMTQLAITTELDKKVDKELDKGLSTNDLTDLLLAEIALIADKVDKEVGKGLSDENFTDPLKQKLLSIESVHYKGNLPSLAELELAYPTAEVGDFADVDDGTTVIRYVWNEITQTWEPRLGVSTELTPTQIKQYYESNLDTNSFDDDAKDKLDGIAVEATKNLTDAQLKDRTQHTGKIQITDVEGLPEILGADDPDHPLFDYRNLPIIEPVDVRSADSMILYRGDQTFSITMKSLQELFGTGIIGELPLSAVNQITTNTGQLITTDSGTPVTN